MTQSKEEIRTLHMSANQDLKQLDCDLFGCFPGGRGPWQGSERTSLATDCRQARAPTQAAPVKSSGRGASVIARDCGRRRITPAASSKKMSLGFSMSSTRCVSVGAACVYSFSSPVQSQFTSVTSVHCLCSTLMREARVLNSSTLIFSPYLSPRCL